MEKLNCKNCFFFLTQLFKCSGGHPHNWNHISDITLKSIEDFTHDLSQSSLTNNNVTKLNAAAVLPDTSAQHKKTDSDPSKATKPSLFQLIWTKVTQNRVFAPFPDASSRSVFAQSQVVIWASEGKVQSLLACFGFAYEALTKLFPLCFQVCLI